MTLIEAALCKKVMMCSSIMVDMDQSCEMSNILHGANPQTNFYRAQLFSGIHINQRDLSQLWSILTWAVFIGPDHFWGSRQVEDHKLRIVRLRHNRLKCLSLVFGQEDKGKDNLQLDSTFGWNDMSTDLVQLDCSVHSPHVRVLPVTRKITTFIVFILS